jgi:2,4-dienoyl-CoA reductase-like NADH-dependent reductase (Old Yellow Enzyme family)
MGTRPASEIGAVTQRQIDSYEERNKGGVGTIMVEVTTLQGIYPVRIALSVGSRSTTKQRF